MKPSKFVGWDQVEPQDIIMPKDVWYNTEEDSGEPSEHKEIWNGYTGVTLKSLLDKPSNAEVAAKYLLLRKSTGPRRLPMNPHFSAPLPLP